MADVAQPLLLPWVPKMWGAIAGGVVYGCLAVTLALGWRWPAWIAVAMPAVPLTVLFLGAAGVALPVEPDRAMVLVLGLQLLAAAASWRLVRGPVGA